MSNTQPLALPPIEVLEALFLYVPRTGELVWRDGARHAGKVAGCVELQSTVRKRDGKRTIYRYKRVQIGGIRYGAHRIVLKMLTGEEPACVDHVDGDGLNNRPDNIRAATNADNVHSGVPFSASGFKGIYPGKKGKWRATVGLNGRSKRFGEYATIEEAVYARHQAAIKLHGEFARTHPREGTD